MKLGYRKHEYETFDQLKVPVTVDLKKAPHLLIAGKSGSGKSLSARWYLHQILRNKESLVFISDYKGGEEYQAFEGSPSYASGNSAISIIEDFYNLFTEVRSQKIRSEYHYTLFIEEYFGLLNYAELQSKKLKTEIMSKVGEILAVGRGLGFGIILVVQRADASLFASGAREQFQTVISFGRCSQEHFRMLGFSSEMEENPTGSYQSGQALVLMDGQEAVQEILVPWVTNQADMGCAIHRYLQRQPKLSELAMSTRRRCGG